MKTLFVALRITALICLSACDQADEEHEEVTKDGPIALDGINQRGVVGELGVPLGKIVVVEAVVVDGDLLQMKRYVGDYLLKIVAVNGVNLEDEPLMEFGTTPGCFLPQLPHNHHGLREYQEMLVEDKKFKLSDAGFKKAHQEYVGSTVKLYVYESGRFSGIPSDDFPEGAMRWADTGFHFTTHLNVLCDADTMRDKEE